MWKFVGYINLYWCITSIKVLSLIWGMRLKTQCLNTKGNFTLCSQISPFVCLNKGTGQLFYATFL